MQDQMKNGFKESHQRSFHSLMIVVEDKLQEMEALLCVGPKLSNPELELQIIDDLTALERKVIQENIAAMRRCLEQFANTYQLKKQQRSLKKNLSTKAAFLWEEVSGATFNRLQGYGKVDEENRQQYESYTENMTAIAEKLMLLPKEQNI